MELIDLASRVQVSIMGALVETGKDAIVLLREAREEIATLEDERDQLIRQVLSLEPPEKQPKVSTQEKVEQAIMVLNRRRKGKE